MSKQIYYQKLKNSLQSLKSSTYLKVEMAKEIITLDSQNSPYSSRVMMDVEPNNGLPRIVKITNGSRTIVITWAWPEKSFYAQTLKVPAYVFNWVNDRIKPLSLPDWVSGLVNVSIHDPFTGYDDEGKPVFDYLFPANVKFGEKLYVFFDENWKKDVGNKLMWLYEKLKKENPEQLEKLVQELAEETGYDEDDLLSYVDKRPVYNPTNHPKNACTEGLYKVIKNLWFYHNDIYKIMLEA